MPITKRIRRGGVSLKKRLFKSQPTVTIQRLAGFIVLSRCFASNRNKNTSKNRDEGESKKSGLHEGRDCRHQSLQITIQNYVEFVFIVPDPVSRQAHLGETPAFVLTSSRILDGIRA